MALLRWLTGHWLPSWQQLVNNRFFAIYVVLSAGVGAAATYLYDDRQNPKINTLIKVWVCCCLHAWIRQPRTCRMTGESR